MVKIMVRMLMVLVLMVEYSYGQKPFCDKFNATKDPKFVEIALVCDLSCYKNMRENMDRAIKMMVSTVESSSMRWKRVFNLELIITGVEVHTHFSPFDAKRQAFGDEKFLRQFNDYTRELMQNRKWKFDVAFLFTGDPSGDTNGHATLGSVCRTIKNTPIHVAGGMVYVRPDATLSRLLDTFTHEFGHTVGMQHEANTIMAAISRPGSVTFNEVNIQQFTQFYCNYNKISKVKQFRACFDEPTLLAAERSYCGNGAVDEGEQCDCGVGDKCPDHPCCNFRTCNVSAAGSVCTGVSTWDTLCLGWLPTDTPTCDGVSTQCSAMSSAVATIEGTPCDGDKICLRGRCSPPL